MSQRETELSKLKETMKTVKVVSSSKVTPVIALSAVNKASPKSKPDTTEKDIKISQLERDLTNLNEVLNLHRQVEQDLNKKLHILEKSKSKDDINYEYIKNIFTKYVLFLAKNSAVEAKQMESLLFDLLHYTKQEKEDLEKARSGKPTSGLLSIFTRAETKPSVPGITGSYVAPQPTGGRSQSVQRAPRTMPKTGTDSSFYHETPGDFSGISSTSINLKNYKVLQKK